MFIEQMKDISSTTSEVRRYGITLGIVFGLLTGLFFLRQKDWYFYFIIPSISFLFFALVLPNLLRPIYKAGMRLAIIIGTLITTIILTFLFYLVVTPTGLLVRLFGKKLLELEFKKNIDSYWIKRKKIKLEKSSYQKQF